MKSIIFFLFFSFVCFAQTKVEDIQTFTLENGMKVIVLEDHSIANVSLPVLSSFPS